MRRAAPKSRSRQRGWIVVGPALLTPAVAAAGGFTRTQIATYAFPDTVGNHPAAFTDLNNVSGQIRVATGATFKEAFGGAFSESRITAGTYSNDHYASVVVSAIGTGVNGDDIGVCLRASADVSPTNDCYRVYFRQDATDLVRCDRVVNDAVTNLYSAAASFANGDRIEGEILGTTINILKNGALITAITDATLSTGRPGIYAHQGANDTLRGGSYIDGDVT